MKVVFEHIIVSYHKNKKKEIKFIIRVFNKTNEGYTEIKSTKESKEKLSWIWIRGHVKKMKKGEGTYNSELEIQLEWMVSQSERKNKKIKIIYGSRKILYVKLYMEVRKF